MRKIIRSETSYSEPVSFDLEVYTMLKREDLDYLEKEIASLKEQLKREQDCVDFYADKDNWVDMEMIGYSSSIRNDEQCGNEFGESEYLSIGGKLARSTQARREK